MNRNRFHLLMFILILLICLNGCNLQHHHYEFKVIGLEGVERYDYLHNEKAENFHVNEVVFHMIIKDFQENGFRLVIGCSTENEDATAVVKSYSLTEKESGKIILQNEASETKIELSFNEEHGFYDGNIIAGWFNEPEYEINSDLNLELIVWVEVQKRETTKMKKLVFPIDIIEYFSSPSIT